MLWITEAEYEGGFRVRLRFSDGAEGAVDLRETLFSDSRRAFVENRAVESFRRFRLEHDTLVWDNGLDLAPEFLRELLTA
jgi:hypothetical protein